MDDNKQFWERFSRHYAGFMRRSQTTYQQICKAMRPFLKRDMDVLDKTTPRLIQFHTLKNAVNPPLLGGFSIFGTVAA